MAPGRKEAAAVPAQTGSGRSLGDARRAWAKAFRDRGIDTPELDARIRIGQALALDHAALAAAQAQRLTA